MEKIAVNSAIKGPMPSLQTLRLVPAPCFLSAYVGGTERKFTSAKEKFNALAESWDECNLGQSVIDYHDFAFEQIIGMGAAAVPFLLERLRAGESEWIYAIKCISGQEAETPDMLGDEERVLQAWIKWGAENCNAG